MYDLNLINNNNLVAYDYNKDELLLIDVINVKIFKKIKFKSFEILTPLLIKYF